MTEAGPASRPHRLQARLDAATRQTARPVLAQERLQALAAALVPPPPPWDEAGLVALAHVLGGSDAAARYLAATPEYALPFLRGEYVRSAKPMATMRDELRGLRAAASDEDALAAALARYRAREWIRIVGRELAHLEPVEAILAELSDLAFAILDALTRVVLRRERSRHGPRLEQSPEGLRAAGFAIVAQGKLGGRELNVSSDVDLQFIYSSDESPVGVEQSLHERFSVIARHIVRGLGRRDGGPFCYRVDLNLRPEGQKGPLVNSLAAAEGYYESFGRTWERLALIRLAHGGGALWVGQAFAAMVRPFVYSRSIDFGAVDEVRRLKDQLHREQHLAAQRRGDAAAIDIKRELGGIREVELYVQVLQLLHGGSRPELRTPGILDALTRLAFTGLIGFAERDILAGAYRFLRRLENALQAVDDRQTHAIPSEPEAKLHIARLFGWRGANPAAKLARRLAAERAAVQAVTAPLFADERPAQPEEVGLALQNHDARALGRLGFADPDEAANILAALEAGRGPFSARVTDRVRRLGGALLHDLSRAPDPDQALRLYANAEPQLRQHPAILALLDDNPALRRSLADLFGTSEFLGRAIGVYPELIDRLAALHDPEAHSRAAGVEALTAVARSRVFASTDVELRLRALRRLRLEEILRIGFLDVAGFLDVEAVTGQLSDLAEAALDVAFELASLELHERGCTPPRMAVLGLGRLGSREMGYGSDIDLLFVYDGDGSEQVREAVRLAQTLIRHLTLVLPEGPLYAIDTRLRPSGNQGPLVSTVRGFVAYHREHAMLWERQALLRGRAVAGDRALGEQVLADVHPYLYPPELAPDANLEVHRMRVRIEQELGPRAGESANVKTGRGGLTDIEFLTQYLRMLHGHAQPTVCVTGTLDCLRQLGETGVLNRRRTHFLVEAYRFLRLLENRLRIVQDRPIDAIVASRAAWEQLARRMGYAGPDGTLRLQRELRRTTERVRRAYEDELKVPAGHLLCRENR